MGPSEGSVLLETIWARGQAWSTAFGGTALSDTPSWTSATISGLFSLQQHSFAPSSDASSCSKPQPQRCRSPTICLASLQPAIPAPPFGPKPLSHPWAPSPPLNVSSFNKSSSSAAFPSFIRSLQSLAPSRDCLPSFSSLWHYFISALFHPSEAHFSE